MSLPSVFSHPQKGAPLVFLSGFSTYNLSARKPLENYVRWEILPSSLVNDRLCSL
jgi:hypothetical protein